MVNIELAIAEEGKDEAKTRKKKTTRVVFAYLQTHFVKREYARERANKRTRKFEYMF